MTLFARLSKRLRKSLSWLGGWWRVRVEAHCRRLIGLPAGRLDRYARRVPFIERKEFSQNGEDGMIEVLFAVIVATNRYVVEFGVEDGVECNARYLLTRRGWTGLLMDGEHENPAINLRREFITAENIEELFRTYGVPPEPDLLSIDIDGNDYWVWKAIMSYRPRVVVIEYNACIPYAPAVTIPYDPAFRWDKTDYYGASLSALVLLGQTKGYTLVATDPCGVNAFFVREDLVERRLTIEAPERLYHPAGFKGRAGQRHPEDPRGRPWIRVA